MYLDQKKAEKATEAKRKAEVMHRELEELKLKKRKMEQLSSNNDVVGCGQEGPRRPDKKHNFSLLASSNALRASANKMLKTDIPHCETEIVDLTKRIQSQIYYE